MMDEKMYLSYSSTKQHRLCPAQWAFQRLDHIEPNPDTREGADIPVERDFGSWWHALRAVDSAQRGTEHGSIKYTPDTLSTPTGLISFSEINTPGLVFERLTAWWDRAAPAVRAEWVDRLGEDPVTRLRELDERWREQWALDLRYERPIAVELGWERELFVESPDDENGHGGLRYVLIGYVDEVFEDTRRGVVVARDHKTHKKLGQISRADEMLDSQLSLYAWGAASRVSELCGKKIQATAYDRVRMVAPKLPAVTKSGTLSKSVTDYDVATYCRWCAGQPEYPGLKKDGSGAGVYEAEQAVIERLSTPGARADWFARSLTPLSAHTVRAHLQAALDSARTMSATRDRHLGTRVAPQNFGAACRWCDYAALCHAQLVGGPSDSYDLEAMGLRKRVESHSVR